MNRVCINCVFKMLIALVLKKGNLIECCKRLGSDLLDSDAVIRKIEYLGSKKLPYRMANHYKNPTRHSFGNFFVYHIDMKPDKAVKLRSQYQLDSDIVRAMVMVKEQKVEDDYKCTLEAEMLPPSYRESVQSIMKKPKPERVPRWYSEPEKVEYEL
ncbi:putative 28S ribosomal protein S6-like protein [Leptotrombidium deliense]|uniref:Small ribosomal subunit protein bS6m n=1 Tax=Leptotrombidium deliense TaxID=299467 RepID=A0A443SIC8_9ACAR|nr:putative 28S ribosomal protein S6-like protein [Leptotrombidium deliense]